ncbi:MAG: DUF1127 domain-containing protein [Gammaproteobacteria bacterium]|nr:DUF1127 domain-containing protein [Gammaproteobacteria bacterium]MCY4218112.1 DUF1127 domain-containing protein [Gammaproteobacteria bacterium]MCY4274830.1 DUF1127 domain-containing protein [Gammaproteobacteria bacterium]
MNTLRNWYLQRKTIKELQALPDYILEDIGINRYGIERFVTEQFPAQANKTRYSFDIRSLWIKPLRVREAV